VPSDSGEKVSMGDDVTAAETGDQGVNGYHYSAINDRLLDAGC